MQSKLWNAQSYQQPSILERKIHKQQVAFWFNLFFLIGGMIGSILSMVSCSWATNRKLMWWTAMYKEDFVHWRSKVKTCACLPFKLDLRCREEIKRLRLDRSRISLRKNTNIYTNNSSSYFVLIRLIWTWTQYALTELKKNRPNNTKANRNLIHTHEALLNK